MDGEESGESDYYGDESGEADLDEESGELDMDDLTSEAEEGIREMMQERLVESSDEYGSMDDGEQGKSEYSEDSFEKKYGEKRIEVIEEKLGYHCKDEPKPKRKDSKTSDQGQKRRKDSTVSDEPKKKQKGKKEAEDNSKEEQGSKAKKKKDKKKSK